MLAALNAGPALSVRLGGVYVISFSLPAAVWNSALTSSACSAAGVHDHDSSPSGSNCRLSQPCSASSCASG
jgi:hypothetical protein